MECFLWMTNGTTWMNITNVRAYNEDIYLGYIYNIINMYTYISATFYSNMMEYK